MNNILSKYYPLIKNGSNLVPQTIQRSCFSHQYINEESFEKKHFANRPENESIELKRARLLYQSRKRGMLENDLLLATFAKKYLNTMSKEELEMYDRMINTVSNEWDLYHWGVGRKEIPPEYRNPIMNKFIDHVKNTKREKRLRQPDL